MSTLSLSALPLGNELGRLARCWLSIALSSMQVSGSLSAGTSYSRQKHGTLQQDGKIERFDAYVVEPHGGDLAGFFMLHGERSALDAIRSSPEFQRVVVRAGSIVDNLGVVSAYGGDALAQQMALFGEVSQGLPQAKWATPGGIRLEPHRKRRLR